MFRYLLILMMILLALSSRAGGLSAGAFPEGAVFTRESVAEQESSFCGSRIASEIRRNYAPPC